MAMPTFLSLWARRALLLVLALLASAAASQAVEPLASPEGRVILTVSGNIEATNSGDKADLDKAVLEAIGWKSFESYTRWTDGLQTFEGVPLTDLLDRLGAKGTNITATALNDYSVEIPYADAAAFDVQLVLKHNGEYMSVRNNGPIWIIFPYLNSVDEIPDLHANRMVWQLRYLDIQ